MEVSTQGSSAHSARLLRDTQHTRALPPPSGGLSCHSWSHRQQWQLPYPGKGCRRKAASRAEGPPSFQGHHGGRDGGPVAPEEGRSEAWRRPLNCLSLGRQHEPRWSRPWAAPGGWRAPPNPAPPAPPHRVVVEHPLCRKRPLQVSCPGRPGGAPQDRPRNRLWGGVPVLGQWQNAPLPAEAPRPALQLLSAGSGGGGDYSTQGAEQQVPPGRGERVRPRVCCLLASFGGGIADPPSSESEPKALGSLSPGPLPWQPWE